MEDLFVDFHTSEGPLRRLLDALAAYAVRLVGRWGQLGADAVFLTDDWGSQTGLMISPAMWADFFREHYRALFAEAHRHRMEVIFHSCGNVVDIVDELIDLGLDVLDPVQPGAMDLDEVAERFGGRVSFSGAVDLQRARVGVAVELADGLPAGRNGVAPHAAGSAAGAPRVPPPGPGWSSTAGMRPTEAPKSSCAPG